MKKSPTSFATESMQDTPQRQRYGTQPNNITGVVYPTHTQNQLQRHLTTPLQYIPQHTMNDQCMIPAYPTTCTNRAMYAQQAAPLVLSQSVRDDESLSVEQMSQNLVKARHVTNAPTARVRDAKREKHDNQTTQNSMTADNACIQTLQKKVQQQTEQLKLQDKCLVDVKSSVKLHDSVLANHRDAIRGDRQRTNTRMAKHEDALIEHGNLLIPLDKSLRKMQGDMAGVVKDVSRAQAKHETLESKVLRIKESFKTPLPQPVPPTPTGMRPPVTRPASLRKSEPTTAAYTQFKELELRYKKK